MDIFELQAAARLGDLRNRAIQVDPGFDPRAALPPAWGVRVVFVWEGVRVADVVGPFDRYFADNMCVGFAHHPHMFRGDRVRVERARVVAWDA